MNGTVKKALGTVVSLLTGIVVGLVIAEYCESQMCDLCCQCNCDCERHPDMACERAATQNEEVEPMTAEEETPSDEGV